MMFRKLFLGTFHLLLSVIGLMIMFETVYLMRVLWQHSYFTNTTLFSPATLVFLIFTAFSVGLLFFCDCFTIVSDSTLFGKYLGAIVAICLVEFMVGAYIYNVTNVLPNTVSGNMEKSLALYKNNENIRRSWDSLQTEFNCCGIRNSKEWPSEVRTLPYSCCKTVPFGKTCTLSIANKRGCSEPFTEYLEFELSLGIITLVFSVVQILTLMISARLCYPTVPYNTLPTPVS